jgi:hypothetical protein
MFFLFRLRPFLRSRFLVSVPALGLCLLLLLTGAGYASPAGQPPTQAPVPTPSGTPFAGELPPPPGPIRLTDPVPDPKQPDVLYFSATEHTLRGVFRDYWQRYGGRAQFGYPLTEEFFEPTGPDPNVASLQVQYFERNRFEMHPENKVLFSFW